LSSSWQYWLGLDSGGPVYSFTSGPGPFLEGLSVVGLIWHHLNCREPGCRRVARHHLDGHCRRHAGRVA
jgi:hypothetical protein